MTCSSPPRRLAAQAGLCLAVLALVSACATVPPPPPGAGQVPSGAEDIYKDIAAWEKIPPGSPDYARARQDIAAAEKKLAAHVNALFDASSKALARGDLPVAAAALKSAAKLDPRRSDLSQARDFLEAARPLVEKHEARQAAKTAENDLPAAREEDEIILTLLPGYGPAKARINEMTARLTRQAEALALEGEKKLQAGDEKGARRAFLQALYYQPTQRRARDYFRSAGAAAQPSAPPLPSLDDFVVHVIQKGESLSILAEKYYGDKFKYPVIAAFNNMADPTKIEVGQKIKVPKPAAGTSPASSDQPSESGPAAYTAALADDARSLLDARAYGESAEEARKILARNPQDREAREILVESYYREGLENLKKKLFQKALELFQKVRDLVPDYKDIKDLLTAARKGVDDFIDGIYKEGITLYRDQKLEGALERWSEVLRLDPDHEGAKKYAEKAKQLLDKLKEMEKK